MSTPERKDCDSCGASILLVTHEINGGLCAPCTTQKKVNFQDAIQQVPALNRLEPNSRTLVIAEYTPGFAADLTSWDVIISDDKTLTQLVRGWSPSSRSEKRYQQALDHPLFAELLDSAQALQKCFWEELDQTGIDDVPMFRIGLPAHQFSKEIPIPWFSQPLEFKFTGSTKVTLDQVNRFWEVLDGCSPHSSATN